MTRRRALTLALLAFGTAAIWSCSPPGAEFLDGLRFHALEERCKSAHEEILSIHHAEVIDLEDTPWAKVVNEQYAPHLIAWELMVEPKVVEVINRRYVDDVSPAVECNGRFVDVIRGADSIPKSMKCVDRMRWQTVPAADVLVRVEHGPLDGDIRPLALTVIHAPTGRVLGMQRTYELLLGDMRSPKNRLWYGMGSAQVSRSCKLTRPRDFISRVLGKA